MDLQRIKDLAFRHCEKAILAIILLFVGLNLYSNLTEGESTTGQTLVPPPPLKRVVSRALPPQIQTVVGTSTEVPKPVIPPYDGTIAPETIKLGWVSLQIPGVAEKEGKQPYKDKATTSLPKPLQGDIKETKTLPDDLPPWFPSSKLAEELAKRGNLCEVTYVIDREKNEIKWTAVRAGNPRTYGGEFEDKDHLRVTVVVAPEGTVTPIVLPKAEIVGIGEQKVGIVTLTIKEPLRAKEADAEELGVKHLEPTAYYIWRRAAGEKEPRQLARLEAFAAEAPSKAAEPGGKPPAPVGLPDAPHKETLAPPPRKAGDTSGRPQRNVITWEDHNNVESGITYYYSLQSVREDENGKIVADKPNEEWQRDVKYTAQERFGVEYTGGSADEAKITILIYKPQPPKEVKEGVEIPQAREIEEKKLVEHLHRGARIGEPVPTVKPVRTLKGKGEPPPEKEKGLLPPELPETERNRFVTGFLLVDIDFDAYRLVAQPGGKIQGKDADGNPILIEVKSYRWERKQRIIVRDSKGRLLIYWLGEKTAEAGIAPPPSKEPAHIDRPVIGPVVPPPVKMPIYVPPRKK